MLSSLLSLYINIIILSLCTTLQCITTTRLASHTQNDLPELFFFFGISYRITGYALHCKI